MLGQQQIASPVPFRVNRFRLSAQAARAESSLAEFTQLMWHVMEPSRAFVRGWHIDGIAEHLQAVASGEITRILFNVPPGSSKSALTEVFFPAWEWGPAGMPSMRYIGASYNSGIPIRDNMRCRRIIESGLYRELWGDRFQLTSDQNSKIKFENDRTGWKLATSVGGVGTGERADRFICLPFDVKILTDKGWLPIGGIVDGRLPVRIAGWGDGGAGWQDIERYERNPGAALVSISTDDACLRCTADHPVFVDGRGYVRADSIRVGEAIRTIGQSHLHELFSGHPLQAEPCSKDQVLQQELPIRGREARCTGEEQPAMQAVWENGLSTSCASGQNSGRPFLWQGVLEPIQERPERRTPRARGDSLPTVREDTAKNSAFGAEDTALLRLLRACCASACAFRQNLSRVFSRISSAELENSLLLKGLCGRSPREAHERNWEWPVYPWGGCAAIPSRMVEEVQGRDPGAGRRSMPGMWWQTQGWGAGAARPSHRLRKGEPVAGQSDHGVQVLPRHDAREAGAASGLDGAIVRSVRPAGYADATYNVRVTPNHNYFAGGILVHNCDDPHSVKTAESETVRKGTIAWFREVVPTRMNDPENSAIIVIMQRVHEEDVSGVILAEEMGYEHYMVPMEFDPLRISVTSLGPVDARAIDEDGDLLPPAELAKRAGMLMDEERFPARVVARLKKDLGVYASSSQLQQEPVPRGGGIIKRDWWQLYGPPRLQPGQVLTEAERKNYKLYSSFPPMDFILASVDTALTVKEESDYSACTVWGVWSDENDLPKLMLMYAWKEHLEFHELIDRVGRTCENFKVDRLLVEAKANGWSVVQEIKRAYRGKGWGTIAINPNQDGGGDKVARAHSVVNLFEDGIVYAPDRDWWDLVEAECSIFPRGKHDDLVDSVLQALRYLRKIGLAKMKHERYREIENVKQFRAKAKPLYGAR